MQNNLDTLFEWGQTWHPTDDMPQAPAISEMMIVDTFTKLIFGQEDGFSPGEELIIHALRRSYGSVALDNHREMGEYLRALGVPEMIQLVKRVRLSMSQGLPAVTMAAGVSASETRLHTNSPDRC